MLRRLLLSAALALLCASPANAFIYWVNSGAGTIARADRDGRHLHRQFVSGAWFPCGLAVAAGHLYWANRQGPDGRRGTTIGRASMDGAHVDNQFAVGAHGPCWVAVARAHIYWANDNGTIARAGLDGTHVRRRFIDVSDQGSESHGLIPYISSLAVWGGQLYWSDWANGTIGDAALNGAGGDDDIITLPAGTHPQGIAVQGGFVYWADSNGLIGRASLDGRIIDPSFLATGTPGASSVAFGAAHLFWMWASFDPFGAGIGKASLSGTDATPQFVSGVWGAAGGFGGLVVTRRR